MNVCFTSLYTIYIHNLGGPDAGNKLMGSSGAKPRGHVDDAISVSAIHTTPRLTASGEPRPLQNARSSPGNSLRQTVHTYCASVHQAAKLAAALCGSAVFRHTNDGCVHWLRHSRLV